MEWCPLTRYLLVPASMTKAVLVSWTWRAANTMRPPWNTGATHVSEITEKEGR